MRITLAALALPLTVLADPTAGLWQLPPDSGLWVQVNADRSTLYCTYFRDATLHSSRGALAGDHAIDWRNGLGHTGVEFRGDSLMLTAGKTLLDLKPATSMLPPGCAPTDKATISGLWQYPGRAWWLQIESDGSTFACRFTNKVIRMRGRTDGNGRITWDGSSVSDVKLVDGALLVTAAEGGGTYEPAALDLDVICR